MVKWCGGRETSIECFHPVHACRCLRFFATSLSLSLSLVSTDYGVSMNDGEEGDRPNTDGVVPN